MYCVSAVVIAARSDFSGMYDLDNFIMCFQILEPSSVETINAIKMKKHCTHLCYE